MIRGLTGLLVAAFCLVNSDGLSLRRHGLSIDNEQEDLQYEEPDVIGDPASTGVGKVITIDADPCKNSLIQPGNCSKLDAAAKGDDDKDEGDDYDEDGDDDKDDDGGDEQKKSGESGSVETGIATLRKKVEALTSEVSEQKKAVVGKDSEIKHLERVLAQTQTEAQLHRLEGSIDIATQMKEQVGQLATVVEKLQKEKAALKLENAKLQGKVAGEEAGNAAQKAESAKIEKLLNELENDVQGGMKKSPKRFNNLQQKLQALSSLVSKDLSDKKKADKPEAGGSIGELSAYVNGEQKQKLQEISDKIDQLLEAKANEATTTEEPEETTAAEEEETTAAEEEETTAAEEEETTAAEEEETTAAEEEETTAAEEEETTAAEEEETTAAEEEETTAGEEETTAAGEEETTAAGEDETTAAKEEETTAAKEEETTAAKEEETTKAKEEETPAPTEGESATKAGSAETTPEA